MMTGGKAHDFAQLKIVLHFCQFEKTNAVCFR